MKSKEVPSAVREAIQEEVDTYGDGFIFLGHSSRGYEVYRYSPPDEPEIGAISVLYKKGKRPIVLYNEEALRFIRREPVYAKHQRRNNSDDV